MRSTARPGSPPQVRGKLLAVRLSPVLFRITPAGAGKTLKYILLCPKWWDHPRRCGENKDPELLLMYILGSPPQVRGKHGTMDAKTLDRGITPAGAGKTHLLDQFHFYLRDHPRRCGENLSAFTRKNRSGGSPPQVRGKHPHLGGFFCAHRITPAGAGKTCTYRKLAANYRDHPRRCGENVGFGEVCCRNQGSPPQVRGKRLMCGFCVPELGITPAGAGKTRHKADHDKRPEDHPRRCGENHIQRKLSVCKQGSPPQVRGKRGKHSLHACRVGITPAGAGKTPRQAYLSVSAPDHPRRCGENTCLSCKKPPVAGSPPQVRGKQALAYEIDGKTRITPAGAGKTSRRSSKSGSV